jgi:hypothetical protein
MQYCMTPSFSKRLHKAGAKVFFLNQKNNAENKFIFDDDV